MKYAPRPYQRDAIRLGLEFLLNKERENGIEILPTGSGKSIVITNIAEQLDAQVVVFQPSKEILEQNLQKFSDVSDNEIGVFSASFNSKEIKKITLATIGSVIRHKEKFKDFKYCIVDECHYVNAKKGMYKEFLGSINTKILGFTATPYRLNTDGYGGSMLKFLTRTRPRVFSKVVYSVDVADLIEMDYLSRVKYFRIKGFNKNKLVINSTGNDYTDKSVRRYFDSISFYEKIIKTIKRCIEIEQKHILVFTRFIEEAEHINSRLGDSCAIVTSKTKKKERAKIISDFREGKIKVVVNVRVLAIGFDFPELDTIIDTAPTRSLALYYQKIGRGIRIHKGKKHCMYVDMCDNSILFGHIEDLKLQKTNTGLPYIQGANQRQLTNVYF